MPEARRKENRGPGAAAENRAALVAAAREVFGSDGFDAPLSAVARRAGVGQGSLYRHFPDRLSLALAAFTENVASLEAAAEQPDATLDDLLALLIEQVIDAAAFLDMLSVPAGDPRVAAMSERVTAVLATRLPAAQRAGGYGAHVSPSDLLLAIGMLSRLVAKTPAAERRATADRAWLLLRRALAADLPPEAPLVVPRLDAGPFVLRPFALDDVDVVREASGDPHIPLITTVPATFTAVEGRRFIERQWSRAERGTGYSFAIADGATGRAVGQAGLWLKDVAAGRASVGYWVAQSGRGRGAAGCAVRALARWAHDELEIARIELHVEPWNAASIRTAEAAGFRREGLLRGWQEIGGERRDLFVYGRLAGDPLPE